MTRKALITALFSALTLCAGGRMSIRLCNLDAVSEATVAGAQAVLVAIFRPMQVEVTWAACEDRTSVDTAIILRLRRNGPALETGSGSLDMMGMAFTAPGVAGNLADVYYTAVEKFARKNGADPAEVLGYVIAHEIGHLLLGPGHVDASIMCARWNAKTLADARQRWLTFNPSQRAAVRSELQARSTLLARN